MLHASYDRIFRTPSFENILLSNSSTVEVLNPDVLRLPVQPSHGDYYEAGLTQGFFGQFRLDADIFRRVARNYADDDQFLNTGVSFPIAFDKAIIDGAEGKLELRIGAISPASSAIPTRSATHFFLLPAAFFLESTQPTRPLNSPAIFPIRQISATPYERVSAIRCDHRLTMRRQADGQNLNNRLNVVFSGNAIAPSRSDALRFSTNFNGSAEDLFGIS